MLTKKEVTKFQGLYKNRFGKEISRENAYSQGIQLINMMKLIYKPMTKKDSQKLGQRRSNHEKE